MGVYKYDPTNQVLEPVAASSTDFGGATSSTNGTHGLVPAPTSADVQKFLSAKGTWEYAGNIFYGTRTEWNQLTSAQKSMFSSDNMGIVCLYSDGIFEYDATNDGLIVLSSRGHVIKNESGTAFTERTNLQIKNGFVSDDSTNDATIIESDNFVGTQAEWNALSAAEQAKYKSRDITDDSYETEDKSQLTTQNKSSLVGAINEVNSQKPKIVYEGTLTDSTYTIGDMLTDIYSAVGSFNPHKKYILVLENYINNVLEHVALKHSVQISSNSIIFVEETVTNNLCEIVRYVCSATPACYVCDINTSGATFSDASSSTLPHRIIKLIEQTTV